MNITIPSTINFHFILELFLLVVLVVQAMVMPFEVPAHNRIAILVFFCLLVINSLTINIYFHILLYGYSNYVTLLQWIQFLFVCSPIFLCIFLAFWAVLQKARRQVSHHKDDEAFEGTLSDVYNRLDDDLEILWST